MWATRPISSRAARFLACRALFAPVPYYFFGDGFATYPVTSSSPNDMHRPRRGDGDAHLVAVDPAHLISLPSRIVSPSRRLRTSISCSWWDTNAAERTSPVACNVEYGTRYRTATTFLDRQKVS